jgi:hypothetical protein
MKQRVPNRRHIKCRRLGITQKKEYNKYEICWYIERFLCVKELFLKMDKDNQEM